MGFEVAILWKLLKSKSKNQISSFEGISVFLRATPVLFDLLRVSSLNLLLINLFLSISFIYL